MNLLIFDPAQLKNDQLTVTDYQHKQIIDVLKCKAGDTLKVGALNGKIGHAIVTDTSREASRLQIVALDTPPPPCLDLELIIALPRPQMIKRILQTAATLGVRTLHLIQSSRVEKSFWQSPVLQAEEIHRQLLLGLEQAVATQLPQVKFHRRFIPFMEDALPQISLDSQCFITEPGPYPAIRDAKKGKHNVVAIGPEGGFIEKEIERFIESGFTPVSLGERILRVETAVTISISAFI